jgi:hypothetical protein
MNETVARVYKGRRGIMGTIFHGYRANIALTIANSFYNRWHSLRDFGHIRFFFTQKHFLKCVYSALADGYLSSIMLSAVRPA